MYSVLLIVAIILIGVVISTMMQKQNKAETQKSNSEKDALRREIGELKQRIQTLERIATDKSRRLADKIDALDEKTDDKRE
ncbi:MAG: hypothetical protein V2J26_05975 [Pacificimonas sp.]|jgi:Tfp pilus assembly protein PilN|nr:hypothetical protein [Pacificimonas sp.]